MGRVKGSGSMGPTRSTRLPAALDEWLESRLMLHREKSDGCEKVVLKPGALAA